MQNITFERFAPVVKNITPERINLENEALHYRFIALKLRSNSHPEETCAVSFERDRSGVIFQISDDLENVKKLLCGESRGESVEEIKSVNLESTVMFYCLLLHAMYQHCDIKS